VNASPNTAALEARAVCVGYGNELVLKNVDFSINRGQFLALLGPNGSGKTTLLKALLGALVPLRGEILVAGKAVLAYSLRERAKKIAYVSQQPHLDFPLTVWELVSLGRYPHEKRFKHEAENDRGIRDALSVTGSFSFTGRKLGTLSGGEKQKVFIARALAQSSYLLLLDEPTVHLDLRFQLEILKSLKRICRQQNLTVVAVLHDLNLASLFADVALLLKGGEVHAFGTPQEVMTQRIIRDVFAVDILVMKDPDNHASYFLPRKPLP
jgi:iron complex transport system ATP-binding protein